MAHGRRASASRSCTSRVDRRAQVGPVVAHRSASCPRTSCERRDRAAEACRCQADRAEPLATDCRAPAAARAAKPEPELAHLPSCLPSSVDPRRSLGVARWAKPRDCSASAARPIDLPRPDWARPSHAASPSTRSSCCPCAGSNLPTAREVPRRPAASCRAGGRTDQSAVLQARRARCRTTRSCPAWPRLR